MGSHCDHIYTTISNVLIPYHPYLTQTLRTILLSILSAIFSEKFSKVIDGAIPKYEEMELNVLYVSTSKIFPFVEAVVKVEGDELLGFQVTRQTKAAKFYTDTIIEKFIKKVELKDLSNLRLS